ncbi:MAG: hypothetical protein FD146_1619 [Anaerolineaceae bacterium]|nr:MAG: hypothetical protein FD146_1619 [Anaerolineaceae bacterium]
MTQEPINPEITSDDKIWAALGYPFALIALIMLLIEGKKNRPFIKYHAVQSLALTVVLIIAEIILGCILGAITFFIAGAGAGLVGLLWFVTLWPAIEAYNGKYLALPWIGDFIKKQGWV